MRQESTFTLFNPASNEDVGRFYFDFPTQFPKKAGDTLFSSGVELKDGDVVKVVFTFNTYLLIDCKVPPNGTMTDMPFILSWKMTWDTNVATKADDSTSSVTFVGVTVIPCPLGDASMPPAGPVDANLEYVNGLPPGRQAIKLRREDWDRIP